MEHEIYHIRFTPLAFEDLDDIASRIADTLCNESAAERLFTEMEQSINRLRQFPHIGSVVEEPYLASKGYRKLIIENYLVFHLINEVEKEVIIMRILHGAREYRDFL